MGRSRLMPIYEFKCRECDRDFQSFRSVGDTSPPNCPLCSRQMKRKFSSFGMPAPFADGWNHQLGSYVSSNRDHADQLKRMSESAWERTGIPCNYEPVHPADAKDVYGVTDEGLDATYRRHREEGRTEKQIWV